MQENKKTIRLGYGEYYELKVSDASKNIINQVEITPVTISTELIQLSDNSDKEQLGDNLMNELKRGMGEVDDNEFLSWQYVNSSIDRGQQYLSPDGEEERFSIDHEERESLEKGRELKVQVQIAQRNWLSEKYWDWLSFQWKTRKYKSNWYYYWIDAITIPRVVEQDDELKTICSISINQNQLYAIARLNDLNWADIEIKSWRYKLQGGKMNVDKVDKKVFADIESQQLQGVKSYTYPEGTLIQDSATVGVDKQSLVEHIGQHILSRYKHGRETISLKWQGDPRLTIGDSLILTDIMGIEKEYMITGSQFVLDSNGSFSMNTEGISAVSV